MRIDVLMSVLTSFYDEETNGLIDVKMTCLFWSRCICSFEAN